jgi:hypothetical protein
VRSLRAPACRCSRLPRARPGPATPHRDGCGSLSRARGPWAPRVRSSPVSASAPWRAYRACAPPPGHRARHSGSAGSTTISHGASAVVRRQMCGQPIADAEGCLGWVSGAGASPPRPRETRGASCRGAGELGATRAGSSGLQGDLILIFPPSSSPPSNQCRALRRVVGLTREATATRPGRSTSPL